ncbi:hypothetical protein [Paraflavitalea speifideaquila]|uniref:hypothetical protein n=1 Tax=Paraflavitalea speifideaquila TaxID=3076558 RepID=UPI0028EB07F2|nr:hypothetical protein [Paraflavitalea speifideiaquila]
MWARELNKEGFVWYHGEHISSYEIYSAFGRDISLPYRVGVGAVQPVKGVVNLQWLKRSMLGAVLLMLVLFGITTLFNREEVIYSNTLYMLDSTSTESVVTPKFRLEKGSGNLLVKVDAPLVNNWLETNITLVNADNGKEYPLVVGFEHYSGYEDGESWSEGGTSMMACLPKYLEATMFLRSLPPNRQVLLCLIIPSKPNMIYPCGATYGYFWCWY